MAAMNSPRRSNSRRSNSRRSNSRRSNSRRSKLVLEEKVNFDDLIVGERYNVTEKVIVKPSVYLHHKTPDKIKIINYIGELQAQFPKLVRFSTIDGVKQERAVEKKDILRISRFVLPGLPDEVVERIYGFEKKSPNRNGFSPITEGLHLSPGDKVIHTDGTESVVNYGATVFGYYKGKQLRLYKKPTKGRKN